MTKFDVRQRRVKGKFTNRFDVFIVDRAAPRGDVYLPNADLATVRKVIAYEQEAFSAMGLPLVISGLPA